MNHICTEYQSWMEGLTCTEQGCHNPAMHDWVVSALCCAHDQVMNLHLVIDELREDNDKLVSDYNWEHNARLQWKEMCLDALDLLKKEVERRESSF